MNLGYQLGSDVGGTFTDVYVFTPHGQIFMHHGTTTATNAVLEGKGARTALMVTAGHKDILALRRS
ncbi:hypothetical protein PENARI_c036G00411 [Penicillium arizonense]|uniref:Hydantoinase/oxoprolinase N-terminal domain-containing protein n=1 Tax=Penicillium arizonense TaxID=1835702 RepID=A0A1F5L4B4_PENAI|nr:hypothetical protein PENARI_c036G00411 [Penicillium arizonense]OGE47810.1 hypothetical protein PENARI_c036G00411 [Penicillium arizonense]